MADKQEVDALIRKVQEAGAKNLLVVYTTREGNQTSLEMVGLTGNDLIFATAYIKHRLGNAVRAFFNRQAESGTNPPVMHGPTSDPALTPEKLKKIAAAPQVSRAVRRALTRAVKKAERKKK